MTSPVRPRSEGTEHVSVLLHGASEERLRRAVRAAASAQPAPAQILVAWAGTSPAPAWDGAEVVHVHPLGAAYGLNRLLPRVTAPVVVVPSSRRHWMPSSRLASSLTGDRRRCTVGPAGAAYERTALLAVGGFDHAFPRGASWAAAARISGNPAVCRVLDRVAARVAARPSPLGLAAGAPRELGLEPDRLIRLPPSAREKRHWMWRAGDRVLHLYAGADERLRRALVERELVRRAAPGARVPVLHGSAVGPDSVWVLEDAVDGPTIDRDLDALWPEVAAWVVQLGGTAGQPLALSSAWPGVVREALELVPAAARSAAGSALEEIGRLASRSQHGDLQPKNVILTEDGPSAIDWEGAWREGLPGLDLLFLTVMASGAGPDADAVRALLGGGDLRERPVRPWLAALGIRGPQVTSLVLACLALWTRGEARRSSRLGAPPRAAGTAFRDLWRVAGLA